MLQTDPSAATGAPSRRRSAASRRGAACACMRAVLLASAMLFGPAVAWAQTAPADSPAAAESGAAPTRMPRPGSGAGFERGSASHSGRKTAEQRFEEANTTHDGHLTEAQAQAAHMRGIAPHFAEIDKSRRGYVTLDEIRSWRAERRAARKAEREKAGKQG